jgi:hypothetical protein
MNTTLWVVQGILTAFFIYASLSKLLQTKEQQIKRIPEMSHLTGLQVKLIGLAELAGAIGITAPLLLGVCPILTPIAGVGLASVMFSATIFHVAIKSYKAIGFTVVLMLMAAFVAYGRF